MQAKEKKLLGDVFAPNSYEEWRAAAEALLKGAPFEKKMLTRTLEGITLQPIYRRQDAEELAAADPLPGAGSFRRGSRPDGYLANPWEVAQELSASTAEEFNAFLLASLMSGQTAANALLDVATQLGLDPAAATAGQVGVCGLSLANADDLAAALDEVVPSAIGLHFQSGLSGVAVEAFLLAWLDRSGSAPRELRGSLNMDPLGVLAASGTLPVALEQLFDELSWLVDYNEKNLPDFQSVGVSAMPCHCAGGSAVEELAGALASGACYFNALLERGCSADAVARQIRFTLPIGSDFFMEIAKLRAARQLWARIAREFGASESACAMRVHARTGLYNKTRRDPYVNMLRTTSEALAAVVGGVDSLHVGAFDETLRTPNDFAHRIARNTQIILQEECNLTEVVDPAGGSWYIEELTDQLARKAWAAFQEIEAEGGILASLQSGALQGRVAKVRAARRKLLGQRRTSLVGTNKYANAQEKLLEASLPDSQAVLQKRKDELAAKSAIALDLTEVSIDALATAAQQGVSIGELYKLVREKAAPGETCEALPDSRLAEDYETLRSAAEAFKARTGAAPQIFLATLGALRRHKLRADFSRAFFEAGGFDVVASPGQTEPEQVAADVVASGASITVVCGRDDDYEAMLEPVIKAIKAVKPSIKVVLAGYPGDKEAAYREAGLDDYIFIKTDNYATNRSYMEELGVV